VTVLQTIEKCKSIGLKLFDKLIVAYKQRQKAVSRCLPLSYLDARLDEAPDEATGIARALRDIAQAKGMSQGAKAAGVRRENLYRALSADGNLSVATVLKVARALGVKLHAAAV
jgi:probable addiction module antidote protein